METPEGTIGTPTQISKDKVDEWVDKKADPFLNHYGKKIIDEKTYNFLKFGIIFLAISIVAFLFFIYDGKLNTNINQNFTCAEIPVCPTCPSTPCPANICSLSCGNVSFPSININLTNYSV